MVVLQDPAIVAAGAADAAHDDHDDERRFPCTKCTERFARADVLKNHMAVHSDEKPFKCEQDGSKCSYKFKASLWKHEKIHPKKTPKKNSKKNSQKNS